MKNYLLCGILFISACQPFVNSRGNVVISEKLDSLIIGKTTMEDVIKLCGTPSLQQNEFTWIYTGAVSEETSFKGIKLKDKFVIKLIFDKNKILRDIKRKNLKTEDITLEDDKVAVLISEMEAKKLAKQKCGCK